MNNIIQYVRNRNAATNQGYSDLGDDLKSFEDVQIDTVLQRSNSAVDINAAVDGLVSGADEGIADKRLTSNSLINSF